MRFVVIYNLKSVIFFYIKKCDDRYGAIEEGNDSEYDRSPSGQLVWLNQLVDGGAIEKELLGLWGL